MFRGSFLEILDNSGGLTASIIRVLNSKYEHPKVGSTIVVAVKTALIDKKIKKHDIRKGVIIQTKQKIFRKEHGITLSFNKNALIIFGRGNNPLASRVKGIVVQELRYQKMVKLLMMAPSVV